MTKVERILAAAALTWALTWAVVLGGGAVAAPAVAVAGFGFTDTSGESADQTADHARRLAAFMQALRRDLAEAAHVRVVALSCGGGPCAAGAPGSVSAAREAKADLLLLGAIHKMSTLVAWAKVTLIDVASRRPAFDKIYTFRGDTDLAWQNAEHFIVQDIAAHTADPAVPIALFPFELDDFSAGAAFNVTNPVDRGQIQEVTDTVRTLLARSGRYVPVDVAGAKDDAAGSGTLPNCNDCDAPIARRLGALQSLVGVIRRISQTEFAVHIVIHDAQSGRTIADVQSGLHIGAAYAWSRGAAQLVTDQVLARPDQR